MSFVVRSVSHHQLGIALDVRAGTGSEDEFICMQEFAQLNPQLGVRFPLGKHDYPHMERDWAHHRQGRGARKSSAFSHAVHENENHADRYALPTSVEIDCDAAMAERQNDVARDPCRHRSGVEFV